MMGYFGQDMIEAECAFQSWLKAKGKTIPTQTKTIMMPKQVAVIDFEAERALRKEWQADVKAEKEAGNETL